ncbi:MAG: hypothetical protein JWN04_2810 [Myxococcaceae bacterium]|nr:hypothetical protein [Myxococcaceae bacterium]
MYASSARLVWTPERLTGIVRKVSRVSDVGAGAGAEQRSNGDVPFAVCLPSAYVIRAQFGSPDRTGSANVIGHSERVTSSSCSRPPGHAPPLVLSGLLARRRAAWSERPCAAPRLD